MTRLNLQFLGPPVVEHGGERADFPTRKSLALLIYLALEGGLHARETLAALFWPESSAERSGASLRRALYRLRSALGETDSGHEPSHLIVERDALGFNFDADYTLDTELVEEALESLEGTPGKPSILQGALEAYRGDFLEGFNLDDSPRFDNWASLQRESWHRSMDVFLDRLSTSRFEAGRFDAAREAANRWISHDPYNEAAYRRLMRVHYAAGEKNAALHAYQQCCVVLDEELDAEPAPETQALARRIREEAPSPREQRQRREDDRQTIQELPLVGRAEEFNTLADEYHRATGGQPRAVLLSGEAGIGKTRLGGEFLRWAAAEGAEVLRGRSYQTGSSLPYQPVVEALRSGLAEEDGPVHHLETLLPEMWLAELSRLLPEIREQRPDLPRPEWEEEDTARGRLFEAIVRLTRALQDARPLVFFLDDLQWADHSTLDLLRYACRRWREDEVPGLLLLAVRSEALHPLAASGAAGLPDWLAELEKDIRLTRLALEPLTAGNTEQLIRSLAEDAGASPDFATWLYDETRGQPFYMNETLMDLLDREVLKTNVEKDGRLVVDFSAALDEEGGMVEVSGIAPGIRQLVTARLKRLSEAGFSLVAAGAVLERDFTFEILRQVAGLSENEALSALDEALGNHLLRERGKSYSFTHDKIREVAYTEAGDARRRVFHRRALRVLDERKAPVAERAHHALVAGESEAAFEHSMAAGDQALDVFAAREALAHYENARALLPQLSEVRPHRLEDLYLSLGRAAELSGDYDQALAVYEELETRARERGDQDLELAALMARTTVYAAPTGKASPDQAEEILQETLDLTRELENHEAEAKVLWNLMIHIFFTDPAQAIEYGEASLTIAREHGLREQMAYTLHDLHRPYIFTGQPEKGLAALQEAQELWRELGNKAMLADNLANLGTYRVFGGDYEGGWSASEEAIQLSEEIDNLWGQSFGRIIMSLICFDRGDFGRGIPIMKECIRLGEQAGFMVPAVDIAPVLAWTFGLLGDVERGLEWAERSRVKAEEHKPDLLVSPLAALTYLHGQAGDVAEAERWAAEARGHRQPEQVGAGLTLSFLAEAELDFVKEEYDRVVENMGEYLAMARKRGIQPFQADALYHQGRAQLSRGKLDEAESILFEARDEAQALNARRVLWRILAALSDLHERRGDEERAEALRQEAAGLITWIADHVGDSTLRASFVARPPVRQVLDDDAT